MKYSTTYGFISIIKPDFSRFYQIFLRKVKAGKEWAYEEHAS
jgi:hypothetical protein